jgi:hypothetical protein
MQRSVIARSAAAALLVLAAVVPQVGAYAGQVAANIVVEAPSTNLNCISPLTVRATVMDAKGAPVGGATVDWTIPSAQAGDHFGSAQSVTDGSGVAQVALWLACRTEARTIRAANGAAFGQVVLAPGSAFLPVIGTSGSVVGRGATGYTPATKVVRVGETVTFGFALGAAAHGQSAQIWTATRGANGTWSAFRQVSNARADGAGVVRYAVRLTQPGWISVQARFVGTITLHPVLTPAAQARWR